MTDSTNAQARACALRGDAEGLVVTADLQTAGRGRLGRTWESPRGAGLAASFLLRPSRPLEDWGGLPLLCGVVAVDALREHTGVAATLRWPNDVLTDRGKIAGILVETGIGAQPWAVCGIGINIGQREFPGEYRTTPTSVFLETGAETDGETLLAALCRALGRWYERWTREGNAPVFAAWRERSTMLGQAVRIETGSSKQEAVALDLAEDGGLLVRFDDGRRDIVHAGDVSIREVARDA